MGAAALTRTTTTKVRLKLGIENIKRLPVRGLSASATLIPWTEQKYWLSQNPLPIVQLLKKMLGRKRNADRPQAEFNFVHHIFRCWFNKIIHLRSISRDHAFIWGINTTYYIRLGFNYFYFTTYFRPSGRQSWDTRVPLFWNWMEKAHSKQWKWRPQRQPTPIRLPLKLVLVRFLQFFSGKSSQQLCKAQQIHIRYICIHISSIFWSVRLSDCLLARV